MKKAFFIAHGAPTLYLETNAYTDKLKQFRQEYPHIKRLLFFSAHHDRSVLNLAAVNDYSTIHDFYGFEDELYQVKMPTQGDPELAQSLSDYLTLQAIPHVQKSQAGLDHGTWTVLKLIDLENELKVVNASISTRANPQDYVDLGNLLMDWMPEDTALIFSGGLIHNLRALKFNQSSVDQWAYNFHIDLNNVLEGSDPHALLELLVHPDYPLAAPTPDHFIGIFLVYGTIVKKGYSKRLSQLFQHGNLSLDYWEFTRD